MQASRSVGVGRSAVLFSAAIAVGVATGAASLQSGARQDERVPRSLRPVISTSVGQDESPRLDALQPIEVATSDLGRINRLGTGLGGAVGPDHYVQTLGSAFAIYDKAGARIYPQGLEPAGGRTLWQGFGGTCENTSGRDLTVLYDRQAGRWMMSQLAASGNSVLCIAISQTNDPAGPWFRYAFAPFASRRIDNPHFGIWPDGYYMSVDQSLSSSLSGGAGVIALEREKMLAGLPARAVYFDLSPRGLNARQLLPSDLDGAVMPPDGSPNYFVQLDDEAWGYEADQLEIFEFHVDWKVPSKSTFTGPSIIDLSAPGIGFDSTPERLIHRLAYRNFGDHESLVFDHSVNVNGADHAGIRWYEMRSPGSAPAIYQAGTYAPDADDRWNGSIAMDRQGNIALAYAVSSESTSPSVRYAGRLAGDPLGTLPQDEITLGGGSVSRALPSPARGNFGSVTIDPADDCTFWVTQDDVQNSDDGPWQTRITSFRFPSCAAVPAGAGEGASTNDGEAAATGVNLSVADKTSGGAFIIPAAGETSVTLAWDANTEPDVAGYEVSYGTQSMVYSTVIDAGNVTSQPLAISPGSVYYFAVRAYTSVTPRLYSPYSAEISYTAAPPIIISLVANRKSPVDLDGATSFASTFPFTADGVSSIVWTAAASGGVAPLQYQFQRFSAATRLYTIVQDWSTANMFAWTPTPAEAGRYFIRLHVRSNGVTEAQASRWTSGFDIR